MMTTRRHRDTARPGGFILLAVLIALVMATTLAMSFLARQQTTLAIASTRTDSTQARLAAESAIQLTLEYVRGDEDWRENHSEGLWYTLADLHGATVEVYAYDGVDEDGDGVVDSDGDLLDDVSDPLTVIAVADLDGVRFELQAEARPRVSPALGKLVLVTGTVPPSAQDQLKAALFSGWGWEVTVIQDSASASTFADELSDARVVYVSEQVASSSVASKLTFDLPVGIVNEESGLNDDLGVTLSAWTSSTESGVTVVDAGHAITSGFGTGALGLHESTGLTSWTANAVAQGGEVLAESGGRAALVAVEAGGELVDGSLSGGRRVALPIGPDGLDFAGLGDEGRALIKASLAWAGSGGLPNHLVGHWRLDQTGGLVAADSSGFGNNAPLTEGSPSATWVPGTISNALDFDGTGVGYARAPDSHSLDLRSEGTLACWVYLDAYNDFAGFIHKGERADWADEAYSLQTWTSRRVALAFATDGGHSILVGKKQLQDGQWYHVVGTWNSAGMRLYIDGVLDASNTLGDPAVPSDGSVQIGAQLSGWLNSYYKNLPLNGRLDDVRIYNRAVTESEAQWLHSLAGDTGEAPQLVALYEFNEPPDHLPVAVSHWALDEPATGGVVTAVDAVAVQDGTTSGGVIAGAAGRFGAAYDFDGVDDYLLIPHNDAYLLDHGSVSFWLNADSLSGQRGLFTKDASSFGSGGHLLAFTNYNSVAVRLESSGASYYLVSGPINTGAWYHVVFTFGAEGMHLYLNGVLADSASHTGGLGDSSGGTGNREPLVLGASTGGSGAGSHLPLARYFDGRMDDARVYVDQLSATQVAAVYGGGDPAAEPSNRVLDTSDFGASLDLRLSDVNAVTWISGGGLQVHSDTTIASAEAATKLYDALGSSDTVTLEAVFIPDDVAASVDAPVAALLASATNNDVAIWQDGASAVGRVRASSADSNGGAPVVGEDGLAAGSLQHVIVSYNGDEVSLFRNGVLEATLPRTGGLSLRSAARMAVANTATGGAPWRGRLLRVAVWDGAVNRLQAGRLFNGDPPGAPNDPTNVTFESHWRERLAW